MEYEKPRYEELEVEVIRFQPVDVIITSPNSPTNPIVTPIG